VPEIAIPPANGDGELTATEAMLRGLDESQMLALLDSRSDNEIAVAHRNRFGPLYVNLLSVFGQELGPENVWKIAVECTRSSIWSNSAAERYLSQFPSAGRKFEFRLKTWDIARIRELLAPGKGLIVCTFRLGLYHFIAQELAALGFPVCAPLIGPKYRSFGIALERLKRAVDADSALPAGEADVLRAAASWTPLLLDDKRTTLRVAQALRRGEIVLIFFDGNNGVDGPWGDAGRVEVPFFGEPVSVKAGVARLACFSGAPILPLIALKDSITSGTLVYEPLLIPPAGSQPQERNQFAAETMRQLFSLLEKYARRYTEDWDGASALHRWRRTTAAPAEFHEPEIARRAGEIESALQKGAQMRLASRSRVAVLPDGAGEVWVDVATMRSYRSPEWANDLMFDLSRGSGVSLQRLEGKPRGETLALLAQLDLRGLISAGPEAKCALPA
jgi:hypothetical protein